MASTKVNILEYLKFKNNHRTYNKPEGLIKDLSKLPVTLSGDNGDELMMYLLVRKVGLKKRETYETVSTTPYKSIELVDESFKFYTDTRYYRIDNIKISPISILVYGSFDMSTEDVNISLIMKDGSVYDDIGFGHGGAVTFSGQYTTSYALGKPIDLSAVKSIKLNDTEISVENKYSEKNESSAETIQ